ncbi:MAG: hypothetical protein LBQ80_02255 [Clostridium sp.]|jgi:hypothetical protein|nr:hypothetical protein [Clostridium sp.]
MLKIQNYQLVDLLEFLEKAELKPRASRVRTKLNKLFYAKIQDLQADEMALLERFGKRDEGGALIESQGTYTLVEETAAEYHKEKRTLLEETASVNADELKDKLGVLIDELVNSDIRVAGKDAESLDLLLDALEAEVKAT